MFLYKIHHKRAIQTIFNTNLIWMTLITNWLVSCSVIRLYIPGLYASIRHARNWLPICTDYYRLPLRHEKDGPRFASISRLASKVKPSSPNPSRTCLPWLMEWKFRLPAIWSISFSISQKWEDGIRTSAQELSASLADQATGAIWRCYAFLLMIGLYIPLVWCTIFRVCCGQILFQPSAHTLSNPACKVSVKVHPKYDFFFTWYSCCCCYCSLKKSSNNQAPRSIR